MGFAIARAARSRGAHVTLVHGPVDVPVPAVDAVRSVTTAAEMRRAATEAFARCDVCVMAAAVSDFTPVRRRADKIRRSGTSFALELRPTEDILSALGARKGARIVVGFALETEDGEANATRKAREKNCDYMVLNEPGKKTGFSVATNRITVFKGRKKLFATPLVSKDEAAALILDAVAADRRLKRSAR
jgi:phosphopantothenoylcysteine decarboxylase/phosphopantothenate--cysteine ligase